MVQIIDDPSSSTSASASTGAGSASSGASASASSEFKCDICGKQLSTPQGLGGHKRLAHGVGTSASASTKERSKNSTTGNATSSSPEEMREHSSEGEGVSLESLEERLDRLEARYEKHTHPGFARSEDFRELKNQFLKGRDHELFPGRLGEKPSESNPFSPHARIASAISNRPQSRNHG